MALTATINRPIRDAATGPYTTEAAEMSETVTTGVGYRFHVLSGSMRMPNLPEETFDFLTLSGNGQASPLGFTSSVSSPTYSTYWG